MEISIDYSVYEKGKKKPQYSIDSDLTGRESLADILVFLKLNLIKVAFSVLDEEQARGFPQNPIVTVDNRNNKPISDVSPLGKIFFTRQAVLDKVILEIYEGLLARSRTAKGTYITQHFVYLGPKLVATSYGELKAWMQSGPTLTPGEIFRFVNVAPYAGMLERENIHSGSSGKGPRLRKSTDKKQRLGEFVRRPNGAYFLTWRAISRKYKFNSPVRFEFVSGRSLDLSRAAKSAPGRRVPFRRTFAKGSRYKGPYVYPAIRLLVTENGFVRA